MSLRRGLIIASLAVAGLGPPALLLAQGNTGTVRGQVTRSGPGGGVAGAQVFVVGTRVGGVTDAEGRYTFTQVPAGTQTVRVRALGFQPMEKTVDVTAGQLVTQDFVVTPTAVSLDEVVVTGTAGSARKREVGNSIGQVKVSETPEVTSNVSIVALGARGGRRVAGEHRQLRQRLLDPAARHDERRALEPAADLHRRRAHAQRRVSAQRHLHRDDAARRQRVRQPAQRHQSRGHRAHRDREGRGRGDAVRHRCRGRRHPDLHEARRATAPRNGRRSSIPASTSCRSSARTPCRCCSWTRSSARACATAGTPRCRAARAKHALPRVGRRRPHARACCLTTTRRSTSSARTWTSCRSRRSPMSWSSAYTNNLISQTPAGNNAQGITLNAFRRDRNYFAQREPRYDPPGAAAGAQEQHRSPDPRHDDHRDADRRTSRAGSRRLRSRRGGEPQRPPVRLPRRAARRHPGSAVGEQHAQHRLGEQLRLQRHQTRSRSRRPPARST